MNVLQSHATVWINPSNILLSRRSKSLRITACGRLSIKVTVIIISDAMEDQRGGCKGKFMSQFSVGGDFMDFFLIFVILNERLSKCLRSLNLIDENVS